jgi:hypothetical protein
VCVIVTRTLVKTSRCDRRRRYLKRPPGLTLLTDLPAAVVAFARAASDFAAPRRAIAAASEQISWLG